MIIPAIILDHFIHLFINYLKIHYWGQYHENENFHICQFVVYIYLYILIYIYLDLSQLGVDLFSPILRNSDTESIKSDSDAPPSKRRRLSVSSQVQIFSSNDKIK